MKIHLYSTKGRVIYQRKLFFQIFKLDSTMSQHLSSDFTILKSKSNSQWHRSFELQSEFGCREELPKALSFNIFHSLIKNSQSYQQTYHCCYWYLHLRKQRLISKTEQELYLYLSYLKTAHALLKKHLSSVW